MNPAGSALLDTNIVVAHFRNDASATAHLKAAPAIYLPWIASANFSMGRSERSVGKRSWR